MAAPTNYFKLGLLVLLALAVAVATAVGVGTFALGKETIGFHTYFDESVQGLELGAPVKFRGVTIGYVEEILIAPDHRHVDVYFELDVESLQRMGLARVDDLGDPKFRVPPDLRAQLATQGITGLKFVSLDYLDVEAYPPPELPFPVPEHYIPAAPSVLKSLEETLMRALDRLPGLVDSLAAVMKRVDGLLASLERENATEKTVQTLESVDRVLTALQRTIADVERAELPAKAAGTLGEIDRAVTKLNVVLDRVGGDAGLVASAQRATESFGDLGRDALGASRELDTTLREIREAAEAIRLLAETLERDPDMLLKGRAKGKSR